jgi:hypothetical protein
MSKTLESKIANTLLNFLRATCVGNVHVYVVQAEIARLECHK